MIDIIVATTFRECFRDYQKSVDENSLMDVNLIVIDGRDWSEEWKYSKAMNRGIDKTKNDIVCFSNDDIVFYPYCLLNMYNFIIRNPECSAVGPVGAFGFKEHVSIAIVAGHSFIKKEMISGFFFMTRRSIIEQVGYWDTGYDYYFDDADYLMRLKNYGSIYISLASYAKHNSKRTGIKEGWETKIAASQKRYEEKFNIKLGFSMVGQVKSEMENANV